MDKLKFFLLVWLF